MLLVQRDLPGLVAGASDPMNQVTLSMGVFNTEAWEAICIAQDNQTTNNQPKGPAEIWNYTLPALPKLCEVGDQSLLPRCTPQSPRDPSAKNCQLFKVI